LLLPLFLWLLSKSKWWPFSFIIVAIALRAFLFHRFGTVEYLAYWTIIGRIDQFALGMLVYQFRSHFAKKHVIAAATFVAFTLFYWYFDLRGGFYRNPSFPSTNPIWIYLPTIEGAAYAIMIAWYDNSFAPQSPVFQSSLAAWESTRTPSIYSIASLSFAPPSLWMRTSCALATSI
jgi:peptidoglycan/LPS O-acetylase OafA/YrhL